MMAMETFEQVLAAAQAEGSINTAWKKFVNTMFFVPVAQPAAGDAGALRLRTRDPKGDGARDIVISEVRERAEDGQGSLLVALSGADVVRLLQADAAIVVALSDRTFDIACDRVAWLRKSIEASLAKAAKARETASVPAAAVPAPPPAAAPVTLAKAPAPAPPRRPSNAPLDIAALKPRNVVIAKSGLEFFVPSEWRESSMSNGLRYHDDSNGTVLEISGYLRPDVSLAKWIDMRLAVVQHEMRYLKQVTDPAEIHGDDWRDRVKGKTIEFTGTVPGDDVESRFMLACVRIDGAVAAIMIRAPAGQFEHNRSLYKWFLSRVDIKQAAPPEPYRAPASGGDYAADNEAVGEPGVFGMSMEGRIGRARALAYSFPLLLAMAIVGIIAAVLFPKSMILGSVVLIAGAVYALYSSVRLMVLRLHDLNLSGKWVLALFGLVAVAGATRSPGFVMVAGGIVWIGWAIAYCLLPGTDGDNDYGPAPGPNSTLINVGAAFAVLMQLGSFGAQSKMDGMGGYDSYRAKSLGTQKTAWRSPDGAVSISFPGKPKDVHNPATMPDGSGSVQQFTANAAGAFYMVQVIDLGRSAPDEEAIANNLAKSVVGEGTPVSTMPAPQFGRYKARDVRASIPGGMMRSVRFVVVDSKVYMAMAVSDNTPAALLPVESFLDSFALVR